MDFGLLPDVCWIKIMSYLCLADRYRVSMTCYKLYSFFSYPTLWRNCSIILRFKTSGVLNWKWCEDQQPLRVDQYLKMINLFGAHIRSLCLVIQGLMSTIREEQMNLLLSLPKDCRKLEKLYVDVGSWSSKSRLSDSRCDICLQAVKSLIESSSHLLRELVVDSWLISPAIKHELPLSCLSPLIEKLSIFHPIITSDKWIQMNAAIPSPREVLNAVRPLGSLKVLSLHCQSVSTGLLKELTRTITRRGQLAHPHFCQLQILVTNEPCPFFEIHVDFWKLLSSTPQQILVDVSICNTVDQKLLQFLGHVPLHSITFAQFTRYYPSLLSILSTKELKSFVDFSRGCSELSDILTFVSSCPKLERLVYNGNIAESTVVKLACMKNKIWKEFMVNLDNVVIEYLNPEGVEFTDDDVLVRNSTTGEFLQVSLYFQPEKGFFSTDDLENYRRSQLDKMEDEVKRHLSCTWMPLRNKIHL